MAPSAILAVLLVMSASLARAQTNTEGCALQADIMMVVDASGSINYNVPNQYDTAIKPFLQNVVNNMTIAPNETRIGVVVYSRHATLEVPLTGIPAILSAGIAALPYPAQQTNTGLGIAVARNHTIVDGRTGVPKIIIVVTDGVIQSGTSPNNNVAEETQWRADLTAVLALAQADGTTMIAVGAGLPDATELEQIALGDSAKVFQVGSVQQLCTVLDDLVSVVCDEAGIDCGTVAPRPLCVGANPGGVVTVAVDFSAAINVSAGDSLACDPMSGTDFSVGQTVVTCTATAASGGGTAACELTVVVLAPQDCQLGPWSNFSACSQQCDGGSRSRSRGVIVDVANCGEACEALVHTEDCNTQPCDCETPHQGLCLKCDETHVLGDGSMADIVGAGRDSHLCHKHCRETYPATTHITVYQSGWCRCYIQCSETEVPTDLSGSIYPINSGFCDGTIVVNNGSKCVESAAVGDGATLGGVGTAGGAGRNPDLCRVYCSAVAGAKYMVVYSTHWCRCYSECSSFEDAADGSAIVWDISGSTSTSQKFSAQEGAVAQQVVARSSTAAAVVGGVVAAALVVLVVAAVLTRRSGMEECDQV